MIRSHQRHHQWITFMVHRFSGLALALFLPFHFWILSYALNQPQKLDGFLSWTDHILVKFAEFGLVFLLCIHLLGGLRLLAFEILAKPSQNKKLMMVTVLISGLAATVFLISGLLGHE